MKKEMDDYFLFDMTMPEVAKIRETTIRGKSAAQQKMEQEFSSPILDNNGFNKRWEQHRAIQLDIEDSFEISTKSDWAGHALNVWHDTKERLKRDFDVDLDVDPNVHERLKNISKLYQSRPVQVTSELIGWANVRSSISLRETQIDRVEP
jgi:hypothetical protein